MEDIEGFFQAVSKKLFSKRGQRFTQFPTPEELGMAVKAKNGKKFVNMKKYHKKLEDHQRENHQEIKDFETLFGM